MTTHKTTEERLHNFFQCTTNEIIPDTQVQEYEWGNSVGEELN